MITFLSHFSQWYAFAPSSKSPLTNCSMESNKLWWLRMSTFKAMNGASREYLVQKDKPACHNEVKQRLLRQRCHNFCSRDIQVFNMCKLDKGDIIHSTKFWSNMIRRLNQFLPEIFYSLQQDYLRCAPQWA